MTGSRDRKHGETIMQAMENKAFGIALVAGLLAAGCGAGQRYAPVGSGPNAYVLDTRTGEVYWLVEGKPRSVGRISDVVVVDVPTTPEALAAMNPEEYREVVVKIASQRYYDALLRARMERSQGISQQSLSLDQLRAKAREALGEAEREVAQRRLEDIALKELRENKL